MVAGAKPAKTSGLQGSDPAPLQRMHFAAEAEHAVLAYAGPEFVLYAVSAQFSSDALSITQCITYHGIHVLSLSCTGPKFVLYAVSAPASHCYASHAPFGSRWQERQQRRKPVPTSVHRN